MIRNPYSKKRPRPAGWTSSSTLATGEQQPAPQGTNNVSQNPVAAGPRIPRVCRNPEETHNVKENAKNQMSDNYEKNRLSNETKQSDGNSRQQATDPTIARASTERSNGNTSNSKLATRPNPYTKNRTTVNGTLASTTNLVSRKNVFNPYARNKTSVSRASALIPTPIARHEKTCPPQTKVPRAKESTGLNGSSAPGKQARNVSMPTSNSPRIGNQGQHPKVSHSVGNVTTNKMASAKGSAKLPSSMASIRPSSWTSTNDKRVSPTLVHSSPNISAVQQKAGTQSFNSTVVKNVSQAQYGKAEDETDRLPPELSYTPDEVKPIQDEYRMQLIKNANLSSPLKNGWTLFPHQKKAIIRSLTMRRMILALDMGLGKTLIGSVWSKAFKETFGHDKLKVFVICPVSLKEEWQRTAEEAAGLEVDGALKSKSKKGKKSTAQESAAKTKMKLSICSWAKVPKVVESSVQHFVVCCDEAHAMQSTQSQRTKDILKLVNDKRCVGVLLLTGTPMKNGKPGNLFPLLKAVRHPLGRHQKAYEAHFCNGTMKNFGRGPQWDASGASNLNQLKRKVASNLLHMTKEQCLKELPPMTTVHHDVPVSGRYQVQYERSIKYLASIQANARNMRDEAVLGAVQRLRVVCAHAKVEATVELARNVLNKEPAVVVFTSFAQVAKNVHSQLKTSGWPCSLLTGETPQNKRQELVDKFQNGLSSVFVCTFGAGGVGLTLTAASTIILLDRPWTPGETRQAEDRIRRIGQVKKCTSYWMRSFDLDKQIDGMLESKKQTTNAVLDKNQKQRTTSAPSKISINQLVHKFVLSEARKKL